MRSDVHVAILSFLLLFQRGLLIPVDNSQQGEDLQKDPLKVVAGVNETKTNPKRRSKLMICM